MKRKNIKKLTFQKLTISTFRPYLLKGGQTAQAGCTETPTEIATVCLFCHDEPTIDPGPNPTVGCTVVVLCKKP